jgi:hypothetical protein
MNHKLLLSAVLTTLISFVSPLSVAADFQSQPGQMLKALNGLKDKGYLVVKEIKFNDDKGTFEATVANAEGKDLNITINPQTGEMTKPKGDIVGLTAREIAEKVEAAGYPNIYQINTEMLGNEYNVKVRDPQGKDLSLKVDVRTGSIKSKD